LVEVHAFELAVGGESQVPGAGELLDGVHEGEGDEPDDDDAGGAADGLGAELCGAAAVEQAGDDGGLVGAIGGGDAELAGGEQADGQGAPDAGEAMHGPGADGAPCPSACSPPASSEIGRAQV